MSKFRKLVENILNNSLSEGDKKYLIKNLDIIFQKMKNITMIY